MTSSSARLSLALSVVATACATPAHEPGAPQPPIATTEASSGEGARPAASASPSATPSASASPSSTPAAPPPPPGFDLAVTVAGKPVGLRHALAFRRPHARAVEVWISTAKHTCAEAAQNGTIPWSEGDEHLQLVTGEPLLEAARGKGALISFVWLDNLQSTKEHGFATVKWPEGPAPKTRLTLPKIELEDTSGKPMRIEGSLDVEFCGEVPNPPIKFAGVAYGEPRPQKDLRLTIAGEKVAIRGAVIKNERVVLSTSPLACAPAGLVKDLEIELDMKGTGASASGARVAQSGWSQSDVVQIKVGKTSNGVAQVTFDGPIKPWNGSLKGSVSALVCTK